MTDQTENPFSGEDIKALYKMNDGFNRFDWEKYKPLRRADKAETWLRNRLKAKQTWLDKFVAMLRPERVFQDALEVAEIEESSYEKGLNARKDALTGLMTGEAFAEEYERARAEVERGVVDKVAVMGFDLNMFKELNDTYGKESGDEAIKIFAQALQDVMRDGDVVARRQAGGDEFYLLLKMGEEVESIEAIRDKISERVFKKVSELMEGQAFEWKVPGNLYAKRGIVMLEIEEEMPGFKDVERQIEVQQEEEKKRLGLGR